MKKYGPLFPWGAFLWEFTWKISAFTIMVFAMNIAFNYIYSEVFKPKQTFQEKADEAIHFFKTH